MIPSLRDAAGLGRASLVGVAATCLALSASAREFAADLPADDATSLQSAIHESIHTVRPGPGMAWVAGTPSCGMSASFSAEGLRVASLRGDLAFALEAWGRSDRLLGAEVVEPCTSGRRVEYVRGPLTEWYVNDRRGLEQGFTLTERPEGTGALRLDLGLRGDWTAEIYGDGRNARFDAPDGEVGFHYTGLRAWDSQGRELETRLSLEGRTLSILVEDDGAVYPLWIDPWIAAEEAELAGGFNTTDSQFGQSVDIDGDWAVVGVPLGISGSGNPLSGGTYTFLRTNGVWTETQWLTGNFNPGGQKLFGWDVTIEGDSIWVGAPGENGFFGIQGAGIVYEFFWNGSSWFPGTSPLGTSANGRFGYAVDLGDDTAIFGTPFVFDGQATMYRKNGTSWDFENSLFGPVAGGEFAFSVAADGDTAVVGAPGELGGGAAYVLDRSGSTWTLGQRLAPSNGADGDRFGTDVSLQGDRILVGSPEHAGAGAAYVFERSAGTWSELTSLIPTASAAGDAFGSAVILDGERALIGAPLSDTPNNSGSVVAFGNSTGSWQELGVIKPTGLAAGDRFGNALAVSGDTAIIGAKERDVAAPGSGAAFVFLLPEVGPTSYCTAGTSASGCQATLSAVGDPSATAASGFVVTASNVEGQKDGLFFYGSNGRQANPWGSGTSFQCVTPPVIRAGLLLGSGTAGACDGGLSQDLTALWNSNPAKNPGGGSTVQLQAWYRDPLNTSNQTTSLSDALEFTVNP